MTEMLKRLICAASILLTAAGAAGAQTASPRLPIETLRALAIKPTKGAGEESGAVAAPEVKTLNDTPTPYIGPEVPKVTLIEDGKPVEKFWSELKPEVWRGLLQNQYTDTSVAIVEQNGSLSYIPFSTSIGGKHYVLSFNNFLYKTYPCSTQNPLAGELFVGVGVRITADITASAKSVGLNLGALALAANEKKIEGRLIGRIIGLAGSGTLSATVSEVNGKPASYNSLISASSAFPVSNAVLENKAIAATPSIIGYVDRAGPGSCLAALTKSLGG